MVTSGDNGIRGQTRPAHGIFRNRMTGLLRIVHCEERAPLALIRPVCAPIERTRMPRRPPPALAARRERAIIYGAGLGTPWDFSGLRGDSVPGEKAGGPPIPGCVRPGPRSRGHVMVVNRQCPRCTRRLPGDARFCRRCGLEVGYAPGLGVPPPRVASYSPYAPLPVRTPQAALAPADALPAAGGTVSGGRRGRGLDRVRATARGRRRVRPLLNKERAGDVAAGVRPRAADVHATDVCAAVAVRESRFTFPLAAHGDVPEPADDPGAAGARPAGFESERLLHVAGV